MVLTRLLVASLLCAGIARQLHAADVSRLSADNLLLIVNKNEPASQRLAELYASGRKVPAGRILAIDVPKTDEMTHSAFTGEVVPAIREFLRMHQLEDRVTCLVTFYGVPLRVGQRVNSPEQAAEYTAVDAELTASLQSAIGALKSLEQVAAEARPEFKPPIASEEVPAIAVRAEAAVRTAIESLPTDADENRRSQRFSRVMAEIEKLYGPLEAQERLALPPYQRLSARAVPPEDQAARRAAAQKVIAEVQLLGPQAQNDAAARGKLRKLFATHLGLIRTLQVQSEHKFRLETRESQAAFDSELACLWWPDTMMRFRWHENPLHHRLRYSTPATRPGVNVRLPRTLMVSRLDAPTEQIVQDIIATSLKIEAEGLKGQAAFDARGKQPTDAYGKFDEKLREAATELKTRSKANVTIDDMEAVFAPQSVENVALYCGWYSLRNYVAGMTFTPGAVAYHVASGEMISLHSPAEKGWCANLLKAGAVATLGPVAEPYLHSFPLPTEFFPLLMTGKLKLAEVYWLTNPLVSWMNTLVGDPLYNPYAAAPAMKDIDVSHQLRVIFAEQPPTP